MDEEEKKDGNNTADDQVEQDADQTDAPDTGDKEDTADSLEDIKWQVADAYIALLDKTKWWLFALGAEFGVSLNPMKAFAKDFLLSAETKTSDEWFFDKIGTNLKKQLLGKISGQSATLSYDQKDLNAMKLLISKWTKEELDRYLTMMVEEGKDPTKEQDPTQEQDPNKNPEEKKDPNAAPVVAAAWVAWAAGVWTKEALSDHKDQTKGGIDTSFQILTGSSNVSVKNTDAKETIESMLDTCTFFGEKLTINKYVIPKLEKVEKEIRAAGINYPINSAWGYNRRNIKWWSSLSHHALWLALDINPSKNPFIMTTRPKIPTDMPTEFVKIFKDNGFVRWGDRWNTDRKKGSPYKADAMHFQFADEVYLKEEIQEHEQELAA